MLPASELRPGLVVRLEGALYKVLSSESHGVGGKMGAVTHAKLRNVETGAVREWRFRADEMVTTVETDHQSMQFLYTDADGAYFMNPVTFEQVEVALARLGRRAAFLTDGITLPVEFIEGEAVGVTFPDVVELRVAETSAPLHAQGADNVRKEARLENGLAVLVPQFIAPGELVRIDVETGTYIERAKKKAGGWEPV